MFLIGIPALMSSLLSVFGVPRWWALILFFVHGWKCENQLFWVLSPALLILFASQTHSSNWIQQQQQQPPPHYTLSNRMLEVFVVVILSAACGKLKREIPPLDWNVFLCYLLLACPESCWAVAALCSSWAVGYVSCLVPSGYLSSAWCPPDVLG